MSKEFIETGRIVNTHGIAGLVKIEPWADSPESMKKLSVLRIGDKDYKITDVKVHQTNLLVRLEGVDSMSAAELLKGKIVYADKNEFHIGKGSFFIKDLEGLKVVDADSGIEYGILAEVIQVRGTNDVYRLKPEKGNDLYIPAIADCIIETDIDNKIMKIRPLPGLFDE